jgi:hypothetical protein
MNPATCVGYLTSHLDISVLLHMYLISTVKVKYKDYNHKTSSMIYTCRNDGWGVAVHHMVEGGILPCWTK